MPTNFKISLTFGSGINLQQDPRYIFHHILRVSLQYIVKYKRSKVGKI